METSSLSHSLSCSELGSCQSWVGFSFWKDFPLEEGSPMVVGDDVHLVLAVLLYIGGGFCLFFVFSYVFFLPMIWALEIKLLVLCFGEQQVPSSIVILVHADSSGSRMLCKTDQPVKLPGPKLICHAFFAFWSFSTSLSESLFLSMRKIQGLSGGPVAKVLATKANNANVSSGVEGENQVLQVNTYYF